MTNAIIIGTGKIGIDLYIKLKKKKLFNKVFIFNTNKKSEGAIYCQKRNFLYSDSGVNGVISKIKESKIIFDCTSAKSNFKIVNKLKKYLNKLHYINLTPSKFGSYVVPYFNNSLIPKKINLITCGGQTSIPIIASFKKILKKNLKYVELVSSISAKSAGKATRDNINEYIINTETAINQLAKINKTKVIININPSEPPVNMMNSLFFELNKNLSSAEFKKIQLSLNDINRKIKFYIPDYNAILFKSFDKKIFRVTVRVIGQGDYLPTYAGNLDIITSSAVYLSQQIQKNNK
jgi:acetaldehyde dehydrogenase (acetylating)